jgi:hypothetical protein
MRVVANKLTESMRVVDNKLTESMRVVANISAISWQPVLVVEEAGENHRPCASNW